MTLRDFQRDINHNLKKNLQNLSGIAEKIVSDLALQLEDGKTKTLLNSALDVIKPHFLSLGGRVSILSAQKIEIQLPLKSRNLDEFGYVLPGVQTSLAIEAFKMLWTRSSPAGEFQIAVKEVRAQFFKPASSDLMLKAEVPDLTREARWAEIQNHKKCLAQTTVKIVDLSDQLVSEVEVNAEFYLKDLLEWK